MSNKYISGRVKRTPQDQLREDRYKYLNVEQAEPNLGDPPELKEHLLTKNRSKCLEMKQIAEETSFAYYECARVNAVIRGGKILSIINEIEVIN